MLELLQTHAQPSGAEIAARLARVDRIASVAPGPASFLRPQGFDALAYLRDSMAGLPRAHTIEVVLRTDVASAARHFNDEIGFFGPVDGGVLLRSQADDLDGFVRQLCAAPFEAVVVNPPALRSHVAALAAPASHGRSRLICFTPS